MGREESYKCLGAVFQELLASGLLCIYIFSLYSAPFACERKRLTSVLQLVGVGGICGGSYGELLKLRLHFRMHVCPEAVSHPFCFLVCGKVQHVSRCMIISAQI